MAAERVDVDEVPLPLHLIEASPGLGIDFGSTMAKIAFRSKTDFHNGKLINKEDVRSACVKLVSFPVGEIEKIIDFILNNVDMTRSSSSDPTLVCCTGNGGTQHQKRFLNQLNIKMHITMECNPFAKALRVLSKYLHHDEFLHSPPERALKEGGQIKTQFQEWMASSREYFYDMEFAAPPGVTSTKRPTTETTRGQHQADQHESTNLNQLKLPCLIAVSGSVFFYIMVNRDGTYTMVDHIHPGGLTFLGLAHQLTGIKDFDEMMSLASAADGRCLDIYSSEFPHPPPGEEYPIYTWQDIDYNCIPFAKGLHFPKGGANPGDVIFSLYNQFCHNLTQMARLNARIFKIKQIYFCGNFVNSELARFNITRDQLSQVTDACNPFWDVDEEYLFPKLGGMYGAIGAFLFQSEK